MSALKLQSTADALATRIREDILDGIFAAGDALPQEEIAARYGVSRSPLREALRQLEAEGWIIYHPNRGAFVATLCAQDVRELYQVRRILEGGAVRLALPKLDDVTLQRLREIDRAMRKAPNYKEVVALHAEFHLSFYASIGNPRLVEAIRRHHVRVQRLPNPRESAARVVRVSRDDHRKFFEALERRDMSAVERTTLTHLDHLEAIML
ncbi:MAG TPA: GntR family transcriptional regulator, partial [Candidatus Aquilonibacter sp.]